MFEESSIHQEKIFFHFSKKLFHCDQLLNEVQNTFNMSQIMAQNLRQNFRILSNFEIEKLLQKHKVSHTKLNQIFKAQRKNGHPPKTSFHRKKLVKVKRP